MSDFFSVLLVASLAAPLALLAACFVKRWRWHALAKCYNPPAFARAMAALGTVEDRGSAACRVTLDVDPGAIV